MNIIEISGKVTVRDGSGSININGVEQEVIIEESGSGGLTIRNVKGNVQK